MFERDNTIANLACSVMRHFGVPDVPNATLPLADRLLAGAARNVAVLLLDAMGAENMEELLEPGGFLRSHVQGAYRSVFPPTTVAAVTALDSGLFPSQHAWLGWTMYYSGIGKVVEVFTNRDEHGQPAAAESVARRFAPYASVSDRIRAVGGEAHALTPYGDDPVTSLSDMGARLKALTARPGSRYIYGYWPEPDATMHRYGSRSPEARASLRAAERAVEAFSQTLTDTLLLITADHGHTDAVGHVLGDYPDIADCLARVPSIEPRTVSFFVKPGRAQAFERAFAAAFGGAFRLFTRRQALVEGLFGPGPEHPGLEDMLGDYIAVALTGDTLFETAHKRDVLKGVHAGGTERESRIPLIAVTC